MKKIISIFLIIFILSCSVSIAEVDISNLSYDELVSLVNEAQLLMMKSDKWQEVTVPEGLYQIGVDIPAGRWTLTCPSKLYAVSVLIGKEMYDNYSINFDKFISLHGKENVMYDEGDTNSITLDLIDGHYIQIQSGSCIFTPDKGNSFSFK